MITPPDIPGPNPNPQEPATPLPPRSCDTHAHLFGPQAEYPYQAQRSYTPPDADDNAYRRLLKTLGFQRAVLVQPSVYGTDNRRMLDTLATAGGAKDPIEWRGIAVVDREVDDASLEYMHALGVRGIRINLAFPGGISFEDVQALAGRIAGLGWHIQFFVDVSRFESLAERLNALPVPSVVDHMGYVPASRSENDPGFRALVDLVADGKTWVKLTGPNRLSAKERPPFTDVEPFFHALREAGPTRCVFGTDWPHVQLPGPMPNDGDLVDEFLRLIPEEDEQRRILVDNPAKLYDFN